MATSVITAFNQFLRDRINLSPLDSTAALASRDWLISQIHSFPTKDGTFPKLYSEKDIAFGSFARKTKKRPLDDVDLMIGLNGQGSTYDESSTSIEIKVSDGAINLKALCFSGTNILNSRLVVNRFVSALSDVPQYDKAEINRNQEAATLKLSSYDWNFDIVPCFFTKADFLGNTFYLIPDGAGGWKKTDPRKDRDRVQEVNKNYDGYVLQVIRALKYWNRRPTMPSMTSYLIENMILDFYENRISATASQYVDDEIPKVLEYIRNQVLSSVDDPKGIQGDINQLSFEERMKIYDRANADMVKAQEALRMEHDQNYRGSINKWREIFGTEFPSYG